jgi:hypothetical protein
VIADPGTSPGALVHELRTRATSYTVYADALAVGDPNAATVRREEAVQLRCRAAVIESMAILYEELGLKARY